MTRITPHLARLRTLPDRPAGPRQRLASTHEAGAKMCPDCFRVVFNGVRLCPACGFEYYGSRKAQP